MSFSEQDFRKMQSRVRSGEVNRIVRKLKSEGVVKRPHHKTPLNEAVTNAVFADAGLPVPQYEYHFHADRLWRFDIAWPEVRLAIEVQGGIFKGKPCAVCGQRSGGGHSRGVGLLNEFAKLNAAVELGWRILQVVPERLHTSEFVGQVKNAYKISQEKA